MKSKKIFSQDLWYFLRGGFWWGMGRTFAFLGSFLILFVIARFAPKEVYGAYQYILALTGILSLLALPGLDSALVRAVARGNEKTFFLCEREKMKFGFLLSLSFLLISLYYLSKKNLDFFLSFLFGAIFLPFTLIFGLYFAFWQGKKRFDLQNIFFASHNIFSALFFSLLIYLKPEVPWLAFGYFFSYFIFGLFFWILTRKRIDRKTEEEPETISFGKHLTLMSIPGFISNQVDNIILWHFWGARALAIYAFALRLAQRINELLPFSQLALPIMVKKDFNSFAVKERVFKQFLKLFLFSIPLTIFLIFISPILFKIVFPNYLESIFWFKILICILIFSPFSFLSSAFVAKMKKRELYISNFLPEFVKIISFIIFIPPFGLWGGILGIFTYWFLFGILNFYFFKQLGR